VSPRAKRIAKAIQKVETGGNHSAIGKSGERGSMQFLPSTWELWSEEVSGRVMPFTPQNEMYVALKMIDTWIEVGLSDRQILWKWNSGRHDKCIEGVNKHGVNYSSCDYAQVVLIAMKTEI